MKTSNLFFIAGAIVLLTGCSHVNSTSNSLNQTPEPFNQSQFYTEQLDAVRKEKYAKRRALNKSELDLLDALEKILRPLGYKIMVQTSYGAFLQHDDKEAFMKVNCKRADFVVMNKFGYVEAVIEYNGEGHYQGFSSIRDDIKELACLSSEIPFVKITFHEKKNNFLNAIQKKILPILVNNR